MGLRKLLNIRKEPETETETERNLKIFCRARNTRKQVFTIKMLTQGILRSGALCVLILCGLTSAMDGSQPERENLNVLGGTFLKMENPSAVVERRLGHAYKTIHKGFTDSTGRLREITNTTIGRVIPNITAVRPEETSGFRKAERCSKCKAKDADFVYPEN